MYAGLHASMHRYVYVRVCACTYTCMHACVCVYVCAGLGVQDVLDERQRVSLIASLQSLYYQCLYY